MKTRTIEVPAVLEGTSMVKLSKVGKGRTKTFRFDSDGLTDEEYADLLCAKAFKLLTDNYRSKEIYCKSGPSEATRSQVESSRALEIDLVAFSERKPSARRALKDLSPAEIGDRLVAMFPDKAEQIRSVFPS